MESIVFKTKIPLPPAFGNHDVIGRLGHVVRIKSPTVLSQLSWHLQDLLAVTLVQTAETALKLVKQFPDEQFLCADILCDLTADPNCIIGAGNPIHAMDLFIVAVPDPLRLIENALRNVLQNVVIVDNLNHAVLFQKEMLGGFDGNLVILTRDGYRLDERGVDVAPEFESLKYVLSIVELL